MGILANEDVIELLARGFRLCSGDPLTWEFPHSSFYEDEEGIHYCFEWWNHPKKLTVYLHRGNLTYIKVWGPNIVTEMEDGDIQTDKKFQDLWLWLQDL